RTFEQQPVGIAVMSQIDTGKRNAVAFRLRDLEKPNGKFVVVGIRMKGRENLSLVAGPQYVVPDVNAHGTRNNRRGAGSGSEHLRRLARCRSVLLLVGSARLCFKLCKLLRQGEVSLQPFDGERHEIVALRQGRAEALHL